MKIWYITANCGDGSSCTEFYDSQECIDYLTDDDRCLESYMDGDGGSYGCFEVQDGTIFTGITIGNIDQIKADYEEDES